jgi:hypothetical protein
MQKVTSQHIDTWREAISNRGFKVKRNSLVKSTNSALKEKRGADLAPETNFIARSIDRIGEQFARCSFLGSNIIIIMSIRSCTFLPGVAMHHTSMLKVYAGGEDARCSFFEPNLAHSRMPMGSHACSREALA